MRYLLWLGGYGTKKSFTWAEIGFLLQEYWWFWLFCILLFLPSVYTFYQRYKMEMDEPVSAEKREPLPEPEKIEPVDHRKGHFFRKLNLGVTLFVLGIILSTTHVSKNDIMFLLVVLMLVAAAAVSLHLPKGSEEKPDGKIIDWKGVKRFLLPFAAAFGAGIIVGLFFVSK